MGYDQDENGDLVINPHEAKIVQLIFYMYLNGSSTQQIADSLTDLHCKTKKNNYIWSASTILQILQNERHCGDVLARKTWTPNYLDHKSRKNNHDRNQYRKIGHHEAIISRDDFIAVQKLITNAKYGNKELLPELQVIQKVLYVDLSVLILGGLVLKLQTILKLLKVFQTQWIPLCLNRLLLLQVLSI